MNSADALEATNDFNPLSRESLDEIEQELFRRNSEIEAKGAAASEAYENALRQQKEREHLKEQEDEALAQQLVRQAVLSNQQTQIEEFQLSGTSGIEAEAEPNQRNERQAVAQRRPGSGRKTQAQQPAGGVLEDAAGRLNKARVNQLQAEVKDLTKELETKDKKLRESETSNKTLTTENEKMQRQIKQLNSQVEKLKKAGEELRAAGEVREKELADLKKDQSREKRSIKASEADSHTREVRLNRALEELERYKRLLEEAREQSKGGQEGAKQDLDRLNQENKKLEKQKQELLVAFKKQMKLIDILKKQKLHLEAARMLSFTEEEFMQTLESRF